MGGQGDSLTKSELIARIAELNPRLPHGVVVRIVETVFGEIARALARGDRVELRGFGAFSVTRRTARTARNPKTGEAVEVPDRLLPRFRTGKNLRARLNTED